MKLWLVLLLPRPDCLRVRHVLMMVRQLRLTMMVVYLIIAVVSAQTVLVYPLICCFSNRTLAPSLRRHGHAVCVVNARVDKMALRLAGLNRISKCLIRQWR
jgi:hypothetical protein